MNSILNATILLLSLIFAGCGVQTAETVKTAENEIMSSPIESRQPVLVELFTSEGCSSCPPADLALTFLQNQQPVTQAEIITLAFHVDYWNYLGWKDGFSSAEFSQRQGQYAQGFRLDSTYTPQMVVDGQAEFVGSNTGRASEAVANAVKSKKGKITAELHGDKLKIKIEGLPKHESSTVFLAVAEDGITTDVKRGENAGSKLPHSSIVRELKTLGTIGAESNSHASESDFRILPAWKRENLKFVVFVQENTSRKILAVGLAVK